MGLYFMNLINLNENLIFNIFNYFEFPKNLSD